VHPFVRQTSSALVALLAASGVPAASIRFEELGPFPARSTAEGQLSSDVQEIRANTIAGLQVKYVAPAEHCSPVRMHFLLDGVERGASEPVSPGRSSGYFDFGGVPAGEHVVGLRAEGLPAGCNDGRPISWGGFAVVRTTVEGDAGLDARAASLGAVTFYATTVNYSWGRRRQGIYVTADGDVYAFRYEPTQRDWNPVRDASGRIAAFDLQERFSHHPRWMLTLDEQELKNRESALAHIADPAHAATSGTVRYDVGAEFRGAYRLDAASGRYVDVPICAGGRPQEESSSQDVRALCDWLGSLIRLSNQPSAPEEK